MRIGYFIYIFILCTAVTPGQQGSNVDLLSNLNPYPSVGYNDCWGYTDSQGREYALLCTNHGTSIIEITNPYQPVERAFIPGPASNWRDVKTHSTYAYVVTEGTGAGQGLQIIDLSGLPSSAALVNTVSAWFSGAHNLYIDNGFAYVVGTHGSGAMHIIDLSNPVNPSRTAVYTASGYIHDVYVWNDTAYASAASTYDLVNLTNKSAPQLINKSPALTGIYAHSGWLTEDKRYFIACEENDVRDIMVWDLQDRNVWNLVVPFFQTSSSTPVHNVFVKGNYAHVSYYKDGYVVLDITDPLNPSIAGYYDTYPGSSGTYSGAWGAYPYFPSGAVIVSDRSTGLYVLDFLGDGAIPVELTSFTAKPDGRGFVLNWSTATETNNLEFVIQRMNEEERDWKAIGTVKGSGTSSEPKEYSFSDNSLSQSGTYYYRLKQKDYDGSYAYSEKIEVQFFSPSDFSLMQNYPNPFNPSTTIEFTIGERSLVVLEIFNSLGEKVAGLVNDLKEQGIYSVNLNGVNLPSGIYIAKLNAGGKVHTIKMSLLK
jgi:choice-of-anchor B domain-containing protein